MTLPSSSQASKVGKLSWTSLCTVAIGEKCTTHIYVHFIGYRTAWGFIVPYVFQLLALVLHVSCAGVPHGLDPAMVAQNTVFNFFGIPYLIFRWPQNFQIWGGSKFQNSGTWGIVPVAQKCSLLGHLSNFEGGSASFRGAPNSGIWAASKKINTVWGKS